MGLNASMQCLLQPVGRINVRNAPLGRIRGLEQLIYVVLLEGHVGFVLNTLFLLLIVSFFCISGVSVD